MSPLIALQNTLLDRWHALNARDRVLLVIWGVAVVLLLLWFGLVSPLQRRITTLEQQVPELESRFSRMRAQSGDIARLATTARPSDGDLRSTIFGLLAQRKLSAELRAVLNSRVEIRLPELPIAEALDLLDFLRKEAGCRVATLTIKRDKPSSSAVKIVAELERGS